MQFLLIYIVRVILAVSVLINVVLFFGPSNQTFSARNWQWKRQGRPHLVPLIDRSFIGMVLLAVPILRAAGCRLDIVPQQNHCMESWIWWHTHAQKNDEQCVSITESPINGPDMHDIRQAELRLLRPSEATGN